MPKQTPMEKPDTGEKEMVAEDRERRKAAQKKGYVSTILTSGKDLGKAPVKRKTLLGE
jgi:general stress protein YciG